MSYFVRVRAANGSEVSIPADHAEAAGLKPLKQSAYSPDGTLRPEKHRVDLGAANTIPSGEAGTTSPVQED